MDTESRRVNADAFILTAADMQKFGELYAFSPEFIAVHRDEVWRVTHPVASGNPIGAGDAFTAALVLALIDGKPFERALREGAAAALASVRAPTAGLVDPRAFVLCHRP